jgi:hypothetical protein
VIERIFKQQGVGGAFSARRSSLDPYAQRVVCGIETGRPHLRTGASSKLLYAAGEGAQGSVVIKFYRNGFVVDDGELRKLDDPANRGFLEDINAG